MHSLGIYIAVPFCRAKCTYCNFASGVSSSGAHEKYVARMEEEIRSVRRRLGPEPVSIDSIYLGGGTPSVLSPTLLDRLSGTLRQEFHVAQGAEVTAECAPGQLEDAALAAFLQFGVNRISFGVQSLVDKEAASTGRFHTRQQVFSDLERVRAAGVSNLSIDLIAGMPYQTAESWQESLQALAGTGVPHASVYMLEVDDDSRLGRELLSGGSRYHAKSVPSEELVADLYEHAIGFLAANGLEQYEISNFAAGNHHSRHNLKYWQRLPYLGFGLDAHSLLRAGSAEPGVRVRNPDVLTAYLRPGSNPEENRLSIAEALEEAWFLGLRLSAGIEIDVLAAEFGRDRIEAYQPLLDDLSDLGLLTQSGGRVLLTSRGVLFSNDVFARFLGAGDASPVEEILTS